MKRILIDLSIAHNNHGYVSGAGEYALAVFEELRKITEIELYIGLKATNSYADTLKNKIASLHSFEYKDYQELQNNIIAQHIDTVFFPQLLDEHINLCTSESVRVIATLHDLGNILEAELDNRSVKGRFYDWTWKQRIKFYIKKVMRISKIQYHIQKQCNVLQHFKNLELITVSHYSKTTIQYYLGYPSEKIHVFYSPMKIFQTCTSDKLSKKLKETYKIREKEYFLFCNASRTRKNNTIALLALDDFFSSTSCDYKAVILGCNKQYESYISKQIKNKSQFVFLSYADSDLLENLYKFAHLFVFPSLIEGFGYPPIEAMKYGTNCAVSTACSIPEITQNGAILFDPLDKKSIELAYYLSFDDNYITEKKVFSKKIFQKISKRQENDLSLLIKLIIGEDV